VAVEDQRHLVRAVGTGRLEQRVANVDRLRTPGVRDAGDTPIGRGHRRDRVGGHRTDDGSRGEAGADKRNNGADTHDCSWLGSRNQGGQEEVRHSFDVGVEAPCP
jgi:hypothetical protein